MRLFLPFLPQVSAILAKYALICDGIFALYENCSEIHFLMVTIGAFWMFEEGCCVESLLEP